MPKSVFLKFRAVLLVPVTALTIGMSAICAHAQDMYNPIRLPRGNEITDNLSESDIPTGQGGFARDYLVELQEGDQVAIDLLSDSFDTIITLIGPDGMTVAENDDGPDGTTNSLLFARITQGGDYIVRVRAFGEGGVGSFELKVTRLRPIDEF
ncbi:PPC domain-containing protein [Phormidium sp. CCY1219]|uniref:PPC domain-containing protein n=1 Tax=Phormidium sp. CCY1219 TaxID=2886104 RepID=UPI002D1EC804|nr:PPC domain-containing protein [Phormidium sp. CCY1219]MEB3829084.1 PPC domain-containing protein [Phormidium sp. CCY1219]